MSDLARTILDIAATGAGKTLCECCGERVATMQTHNDEYEMLPDNPWVCEECAEATWDRQQERAAAAP